MFSPLLDGLELCEDDVLKKQLLRNLDSIPLQVMRVCGKRLRIENCVKKNEKSYASEVEICIGQASQKEAQEA